MPCANVSIPICQFEFLAVDQGNAADAQQRDLLDDMRPQSTNANHGNFGRSQAVLACLSEELDVSL